MEDHKTPNIKWAQRSDKVFVTIDLADGQNTMVDIIDADQTLKYCAVKDDSLYSIDYKLFGHVDKSKSAINTKGRNVVLVIAKAGVFGTNHTWWPRLLSDTVKRPNILADWNKWREEDDSEEDVDPAANMDLEALGEDEESDEERNQIFAPIARNEKDEMLSPEDIEKEYEEKLLADREAEAKIGQELDQLTLDQKDEKEEERKSV